MPDEGIVIAPVADMSGEVPSGPSVLTPPKRQGYFRSTRSLFYALLLTWPLLLVYEVGTYLQNMGKSLQVMNGADALLEAVLTGFGHVTVLQSTIGLLFMLLIGATIEFRRHRPTIRISYMLLAMAEAVILSFLLGPLSNWLMNPTTSMMAMLRFPGIPSVEGFFGNVVSSCGAGFYEELVYRVMLVGGLVLFLKMIRVRAPIAFVVATVLGAAIFSGVHHIGSLGDPFTFRVFFFRMAAGVVFNVIYATRGFAVAAWTHALYDIWVTTGIL